MNNKWNDKIFNATHSDFEDLSLEIFHFQYRHNPIYKAFVDMLKVAPGKVTRLFQIPFLPIQFFKTHAVKTTEFDPQFIFESSGTGQAMNSHHFVKDIEFYRKSFSQGFELFYGAANGWCVIALLPSYLERKNSSLVFMVDELIRQSRHEQSGFYLYEHEKIYETLKELEANNQKTIFIGVSFALLDFAETYALPLKNTTVMETGGMKGRREEIVRAELHDILKNKFGVDVVHAEYGMTELLSQAYSRGEGVFRTPPWMKVLIRDEEDPLTVESGVQSSESGVRSSESGVRSSESGVQTSESGVQSSESQMKSPLTTHHSSGKSGAINIIDLANVYSCSFIATEDAGKLHEDGSFEVLGRMDNSDIRGCSLMMM